MFLIIYIYARRENVGSLCKKRRFLKNERILKGIEFFVLGLKSKKKKYGGFERTIISFCRAIDWIFFKNFVILWRFILFSGWTQKPENKLIMTIENELFKVFSAFYKNFFFFQKTYLKMTSDLDNEIFQSIFNIFHDFFDCSLNNSLFWVSLWFSFTEINNWTEHLWQLVEFSDDKWKFQLDLPRNF